MRTGALSSLPFSCLVLPDLFPFLTQPQAKHQQHNTLMSPEQSEPKRKRDFSPRGSFLEHGHGPGRTRKREPEPKPESKKKSPTPKNPTQEEQTKEKRHRARRERGEGRGRESAELSSRGTRGIRGNSARAMTTFKGVMLCDRPADLVPANNDLAAKYKPFLPTSSSAANEQLGLTPAYKELPKRERRMDDAMSRHRKWLAEEQARLRTSREMAEVEDMEHMQRMKQHADFTANLRAAILENKPTSHLFGLKRNVSAATASSTLTADIDVTTGPSDTRGGASTTSDVPEKKSTVIGDIRGGGDTEASAATTGGQDDDRDDEAGLLAFVEGAVDAAKAARDGGEKASCEPHAMKAPEKAVVVPAAARPSWARTEAEDAALEGEEADALVDFVAGLDIDKYLEDLGESEREAAEKFIEEMERGEDVEGTGGEGGDSEDKNDGDLEWRRRFARAVNHLANKDLLGGRVGGGKSEAAGSVFGDANGGRDRNVTRRESRAEDKGWDSSTVVGSDAYQNGVRRGPGEDRLAAEDILRENPQLRAVHSTASVQAMLSKSASTAATRPASQQENNTNC